MVRIKLKISNNEIEIDSEDFYVDNASLNQIIDVMSNILPDNHAKIVYGAKSTSEPSQIECLPQLYLERLDDVKVYESEFALLAHIAFDQIPSKLRILDAAKFFESTKTVTKTLQQLREYDRPSEYNNSKRCEQIS